MLSKRKYLNTGDLFSYLGRNDTSKYVVLSTYINEEKVSIPEYYRTSITNELTDDQLNSEVLVIKPYEKQTVTCQSHYTARNPEAIAVMESWFPDNIRMALAIKYMARYGLKGDLAEQIKDLEKSISFLQREINFRRTGKPEWQCQE
jgi:hypothetical protein